jgi:dihydropyrimidinase
MIVDTRIRNVRVVLEDGTVTPLDVLVSDGRIVGLVNPSILAEARKELDGGNRPLLPGIIDPHVHLGFYDLAGEHRSETAAAAIGGITTTVRHYRALQPYDDIFPAELERAAAGSHVDYAYHLGLLIDEHLDRLEDYVARWGITSYKMYACFRGEERAAFGLRGQDDGFILDAFERIAAIPHAVGIVHAENNDIVERRTEQLRRTQPTGMTDLALWDRARPAVAEVEAVDRISTLAEAAGCPLYLPHVSSAVALERARVRKRSQELYVESLSVYLGLDHAAPAGRLATVSPPIRGDDNADAQWRAIADGTIDAVGSDHNPMPRDRKPPGRVLHSPSGIPGMTTVLPVLLSEGVHRGRIDLGRIARLQANCARIFGLETKGSIRPGMDADLVLVDLHRERTVRGEEFGTVAKFDPFEGLTLKGWPAWTMVRGQIVARDGEVVGAPGYGRYLRRLASQ